MSKSTKVKYEIIVPNDVPELTVIEKSNIAVDITLGDSLSSLEYNRKQMEALESELRLKKAVIENVVTNYPEVVNIDEKMQIACHTYYEAKRYLAIAEDKLTEFKEAQKELEAEITAIEEQTGLKKTSVAQNVIEKTLIDSKKTK